MWHGFQSASSASICLISSYWIIQFILGVKQHIIHVPRVKHEEASCSFYAPCSHESLNWQLHIYISQWRLHFNLSCCHRLACKIQFFYFPLNVTSHVDYVWYFGPSWFFLLLKHWIRITLLLKGAIHDRWPFLTSCSLYLTVSDCLKPLNSPFNHLK